MIHLGQLEAFVLWKLFFNNAQRFSFVSKISVVVKILYALKIEKDWMN